MARKKSKKAAAPKASPPATDAPATTTTAPFAAELAAAPLPPSPEEPLIAGRVRRAAPRVAVERGVRTVLVRGFFDDGAHASRLHNVSLSATVSGVFVETAHLHEVGDPVVLTFTLEDNARLTVHGRVRWVTPFGTLKDAKAGMGIELLGLDESRARRLHELLRENQLAAAP